MRTNRAKTFVTLLLLLGTPVAVQAWERGKVERFATLPPGEAHPEGICVDHVSPGDRDRGGLLYHYIDDLR